MRTWSLVTGNIPAIRVGGPAFFDLGSTLVETTIVRAITDLARPDESLEEINSMGDYRLVLDSEEIVRLRCHRGRWFFLRATSERDAS